MKTQLAGLEACDIGTVDAVPSTMAPRLSLRRDTALLVLLLGFYALWTGRIYLYDTWERYVPCAWGRNAFDFEVPVLLMILPAALWYRRVDDQVPWRAMKLWPVNWSLVPFVVFLLSIPTLSASLIHGGLPAMPSDAWWEIASVDTLAEELFFRGFLMQQFQRRHGFWRSNLMSTLLFMLCHWPAWLMLYCYGPQPLLRASLYILGLGLLNGYLFRRFNSIWPGWALHTGNNVVSLCYWFGRNM
jgi:hypothetical protein